VKRHLNTLFVTLEGAYLRKDGAAIEVRHEGESKLRVPLHNLDGIACFGWDISASASLMAACAEAKVALSFHTPHGKFLASTNGFTSGNILLRREQYRRADHEPAAVAIATNMIAAKLANSRHVLMRAARDHGDKDPARASALLQAADFLQVRILLATRATGLDSLRGIEGDAAATYFAVFPHLMVHHDPALVMTGRSRRPPLDPVNALLSFLYSLLMHDCRSALESCGLDAQCGFLHRDRPGRPSLALDLMEEFRAFLADRTALSLFNRKQIDSTDFETKESGAVLLKEDSRKKVLTAWQERKQNEIQHPFLDEKTTIGLLPHLQARLLARHLRGDLDAYPAFLAK
jgi:CRISPR-associated protein Cas1